MRLCAQCHGFIPEATSACPNCAVAPRRATLTRAVLGAGIATLIATGCGGTPMPAYGVACTAKQVDGGNNGCPGECSTLLSDGGKPSRDPGNSCFNDAGIP
jgi:hypothetical protein